MIEPPVPADVDLRDFAFMPLDVVRLRDSDLAGVASAEEFRCAVLLWCASWHQVPAASLPDDDAVLASLAGFGRSVKEWRKHKPGAMRGWGKCSDGRLYHPVVAEKAVEAWNKRRTASAKGKAGALAKWGNSQQKQMAQASQNNSTSNGTGTAQPHCLKMAIDRDRERDGDKNPPASPGSEPRDAARACRFSIKNCEGVRECKFAKHARQLPTSPFGWRRGTIKKSFIAVVAEGIREKAEHFHAEIFRQRCTRCARKTR